MEALMKKSMAEWMKFFEGFNFETPDATKLNPPNSQSSSSIIQIYNMSKARIYEVADNVASGIVLLEEEFNITDSPKCIALPEDEEWDFKLGDTVKIKLSKDDFKWMQQQTIGWQQNMHTAIGHVGIITNVYSEFENAVGVYFPDKFCVSLYAGVLMKVPPREDASLLKRWKIGDKVKIISSPEVLALLQRGFDRIPAECIGKPGRVVGVTHQCFLVTFNNSRAFTVKSSSLVSCSEEEITEEKFIHARGFQIGDQVRIISNLKKLILLQKDHGGWSVDMTTICGEKATVVKVQNDGSLNVQIKNKRAWRLNSDSVLRDDENETAFEDDLLFHPGDVVKVIVPRNVRTMFALAEVPVVFLEYLRAPVVITLLDDDLNCYVHFGAKQNVKTHKEIIRKATASDKNAYDVVKSLTDNLKVGDRVHLDVGPPNFVRSVIAELNVSQVVKMAMTSPAILQGFTNPYTAVIKYEDGTRITVKRELLTVPQKFHIDDVKSAVSVKTIERISEAIKRGVQVIHSRTRGTDEYEVTFTNMREGNPPCIEFRITSVAANAKLIFEWLQHNSGWTMEYLYDGGFVITVTGEQNTDMEIKIGIIFNDEASEFVEKSDFDARTVSGFIEECAAQSNATQPFDTEQRHDIPTIDNLDQFKYLRLYDPLLARNVYFPYVIHGSSRTLIQPVEPPPYTREYNRYDNASAR